MIQLGRDVAEQAAKGGLTLLESGLLGAITIVAIAVAILAVCKVLSVQDERVTDKERDRQARDKLVAELVDLNEHMTGTFSAMRASVDMLRESEKEGQEVLRGVRQALDTVVLEAVRRRGSSR